MIPGSRLRIVELPRALARGSMNAPLITGLLSPSPYNLVV